MIFPFMVLWLSAASGQAAAPLHGYHLAHFEHISDPERSAENIRRHLALAKERGVPIDAYLHRGEHQAAWLAAHAPDVLSALRDPNVTLSYHPHGVRPFTDLAAALHDLPWDEATAAFERLETCAVDYTTAQTDCSRPGGARATAEIVGRPIGAAAFGGVDAVPTWVYTRRLGIPVRGDSKSRMATFSGPPVDVYWHMGALVISVPADGRLPPYAQAQQVDALSALRGPAPRLVSVLATDKVERPDANRLIDQRYRLGESTLAQVRPRPGELSKPGKVARYWELFETALRAVDRRMVRATDGSWLTSADLLERVVGAAETFSAAQLDQAAAAVQTSLSGVEVELPDRRVSHADVYEALRLALLSRRATGALPASVTTAGILGPIGEPLRGPWSTGGPSARLPVPERLLIDALSAAPADRVAWQLPAGEGQDPLSPVEQLVAMAALYRSLHAGHPLTELPRLDRAPWPVPGGVRGGRRTDLDRWDWYTRLQFWTTKRARWR